MYPSLRLQLWHQSNPHSTNSLFVIAQRTQLEEALSVAPYKCAALMRQIDKLIQSKPVDEVVHDDCRVAVFGLAHDIHCSGIVEIEIMHQTAPPGRHAVRASESDIADEGMATAIEVSRVVVTTESILLWIQVSMLLSEFSQLSCSSYLGPVNLEIGEIFVIPLSQNGNLVRINVYLPEILLMLLQSARLIPALRYSRIVLPLVE